MASRGASARGAALALGLTTIVAGAVAAQSEAPASEAPASTEQVQIGFVTHVLGNPFIQQIVDGARFAANDLGVDLQVAGPEGGSADEQIALIQGFQNAGVDGIATSVPGTRLCEHMPRLARLAHRYTIVRSLSHDDLDHGSACYLSLTGQFHPRKSSNPPPAPTDYPATGAIVRHLRPGTRLPCPAVQLNGPLRVPEVVAVAHPQHFARG